MKTRSKTINRLLSLALCLCMVLALLPAIPVVAAAATARVIYLKPNSNWTQANARFAAYFFGNGETWVDLTDANKDGIYECAVPSGYSSVIFCRMNPNNNANNWNKDSNLWNQTLDLMVPTDVKTLYTVKDGTWDKGGGTWSEPSCSYAFHNFENEVCNRTGCGAKGRTIYFQNNWLWGDVRVYYWKGNVNNVWPGEPMKWFGSAQGAGADKYDHFVLTIPADIDGFIINGIKNDARVQSVDLSIADWYDGIAYWMSHENEQNKVNNFKICGAFPELHISETVSGSAPTCTTDGLTDGVKCTRCDATLTEQQPIAAQGHSFDENGVCTVCGTGTMKIFFQNNWMWENISLYYWFEGTTLDNTWPGTLMEHYGKATVDFEGGAREFDYYALTVPANVAGIIINGVDPKKPEAEKNRQTFEIFSSQLQNGVTFYIDGEEEKEEGKDQWCYVDSFSITKDFPCALGHDEVAHEAQAATCTEIGWDAYVTCANCDYSTYVEIPAKGHTEEILPASDPTCINTGLTEGVKCSVCDEILTAQEEIPATGNHVDQDNKKGYCDTCDGLMAPAQLIKTSASLEGNIAVNYFMLLSEEIKADQTAYMQFTVAGDEPIQVPINSANIIDGYYVFTYEVAAKEMTKNIISQFFYDGGSTEEHPYDVKTYGEHILKNPNYDNEKTENLITSMLNYGAASQAYFDYNTGDLANKDENGNDLVDVPDYSKVDIKGFDFEPGQGTDKVKLYSASLILNSETTLRLFFNGKVTAKTQDGQDLAVQYRGGLYYVDIVNIAAKYLDEDVTITINDGTADATITFSPMAYCQIVQQDTSGAFGVEMKNLACALYLYNQAANKYFENRG